MTQDTSTEWFHSDIPNELAQILSADYSEEDLEALARASTDAAIAELGEAYRSPHVRTTALSAARIALGLKPLSQEQGEQ